MTQTSLGDWISRFRALGDETRLDLLGAHLLDELSVGELAETVKLAQPGVSRHLSALRDAGLVVARKQGPATYYRISPDEPLLQGPMKADLGRRSVELGIPARVERIVARRRARTEAFFDQQADSWDSLRAQLLADSAALWSLLPLVPRGLRVADIGTGTGGMLPQLSEIAESIVAVDHSTEMLRRAKARAKMLGIDNVSFVKADLASLPIESASIDAAFAVLVLHHAPSPADAAAEMARILRPGGKLVVVDLCAHGHDWLRKEHGDVWMGFSADEVLGHMTRAGLTDVRLKVVSRVEVSGKGPPSPLELFVASGRLEEGSVARLPRVTKAASRLKDKSDPKKHPEHVR
jgi:ArsR family transcriptional regulator